MANLDILNEFNICFFERERDVILRLLGYCRIERKKKLQNVFGMSQQIYKWRNHYLFDKSKNYSLRVKYGDNYAYGKKDEDCEKVCMCEKND